MASNRMVGMSRFSIRQQVILLFFVVVVLPFLFIGSFANIKSVQAIEDISSIVSLEMVEKNAKNLDNYFKLVDDVQNEIMASAEVQQLLSMTPNGELEELDIAKRLMQLTNLLSSTPHAYAIRIFPIDPSRYPSFTRTIYNGIDVEKEAWFPQAEEMRSPFWRLFTPQDNSTLYKEPILSRFKRLYGLAASRTLGYVAADIKVSTIGDYLAPVKLLDQQQVMLLDEHNVIAYHTNAELIGKQLASEGLVALLGKSNDDSVTADIDGSKFMVTYATLAHNDWKVVSMVPLAVLTRSVAGIKRVSLLFLLFYFVVSVMMIAYITKRFTNPILSLVQSMRRVERGDLSFALPQLRRADEIGSLYRRFDLLVRRIAQLVQEAEREAKDRKELEFQVLTHQINPHFLYNTLEAIRWKAESRQANDISEMVRSLGNLLRLSLNDGRELSTVQREVDHVKAYIAIQNARSDVSVRVVYLIDDEIAHLPCLRLLLQPLVENAIKHGISHTGDKESIKIVVKGSFEQHLIRFEISDNGPGIPESVQAQLFSNEPTGEGRRTGVGLRNVHERLSLYFGQPYGLRIVTHAGSGAVIELLHPILTDTNGERNE